MNVTKWSFPHFKTTWNSASFERDMKVERLYDKNIFPFRYCVGVFTLLESVLMFVLLIWSNLSKERMNHCHLTLPITQYWDLPKSIFFKLTLQLALIVQAFICMVESCLCLLPSITENHWANHNFWLSKVLRLAFILK